MIPIIRDTPFRYHAYSSLLSHYHPHTPRYGDFTEVMHSPWIRRIGRYQLGHAIRCDSRHRLGRIQSVGKYTTGPLKLAITDASGHIPGSGGGEGGGARYRMTHGMN